MTPKEKAIELVTKMDVTPNKVVLYLNVDEIFECNKKASLITVDEIIKEYEEEIIYAAYDVDFELWKDRQSYWEEVKNEIEKL